MCRWFVLVGLFMVAPSSVFAGGELGFLDGLVESLTPAAAAPEAEKTTGLQRQLRTTIKAVEHRYERLFDPAGLNDGVPPRTATAVPAAELERMVARLRQQLGRVENDGALRARLQEHLAGRGIVVKADGVTVREAPQPGLVERMTTWADGCYERLVGR